jgi:hypothetical protein
MPFPSVELEFFATTTFNHAIDLFVASDDAACKHWVERALTLAALVGDQEELLGLMKGRYSELVWGEGDLQ